MNRFKPAFCFSSIIFCLVSCFTVSLSAQNTQEIDPSKDTITVGLVGSEPFNMTSEMTDEPDGIAVEIWQDLADEEGWNYRYKSFESVDEAIKSAEKGNIDLAVGPISITAKRAEKVRFSQPYYNSSLSIISRNDDVGIWGAIKPLFSLKLLLAVGGFLLILAIVGALLWLAEHKTNEEFSDKPGKGIGNGMWLAIVTMSTVGYGDMAARTALGRIITGVWIVLAIIFATSMVAGIASVLSISGQSSTVVNNIEELAGKKTATVAGAPAVAFIKEHKSKAVETKNFHQAMELLEDKKVDAVIFDRPQLLYYQKNHPGADLYLSKAEYYKQGYGFAFPPESNFFRKVNLALLKLAENEKVQAIVDDYLGEDN